MGREVRLALDDVLKTIDLIAVAVDGRDYDAYKGDPLLRAAVERCLEIISEASRHIPANLKARHPEVPWTDVAGIGNILRHAYHKVSHEVVWVTVTQHLAELREAVLSLRDLVGHEGQSE
jgi:uncharacterized protein with HEPN domain